MKKLLFIGLFLATSLFANIGTIMAVKGDGIVKRVSGDVIAKSGLTLLEGDTIITQVKSRVQVMLKDETVVTVGAKSEFSFDEYAFDGANSKVAMSSSRGFFRSVTGKIGKLAPQRFKVKTASATIGIRGTDFWGTTGGDSERFTCNKGSIVIKFAGGERVLPAGRYLKLGPNGAQEGDQGDDQGDEEGSGNDEGTDDEDSDDEEETDDEGGVVKNLKAAVEVDGTRVEIKVEDIADVIQGVELEGLGVEAYPTDRLDKY